MRYSRFVVLIGVLCLGSIASAAERLPNFVILFADDMGYGDPSCYGHPTIRTPQLDRMADEGMRFTDFYSAASVCTPSRAAILTGRLPVRTGMYSEKRRVLWPDSLGGLPDSEITIAEGLKTKGYATACIGKWHLGHHPEFLPTHQGFDSYYGIPYSNDMKPVCLLRNEQIIEEPVDQTTLTRRYTDEAIHFIESNRRRPFFLYFAHTFPHVPLFASDAFKGTSRRGLYGDVVEELDWSVGKVLDKLRELDLADDTLVIFTSDNGPWIGKELEGGSAGVLRGGKGTTWEGGMREPGIFWWPGHIPAGTVSSAIASTLDCFPTIVKLAGVPLPADRVIDGADLMPVLRDPTASVHDDFIYYRCGTFMALRKGPWKAHWRTRGFTGPDARKAVEYDPPLLFHLGHDPAEAYNVAAEHPDIVAELQAAAAAAQARITVVPSAIEEREPPTSQPAHDK